MINRESKEYQEAKDRVKIAHFTEKGHDIKGIIHVGANDGYEIQFYLKMGIEKILAFEPLESAANKLIEKYMPDPRITLCYTALGDQNHEARINITKGDGKSSSLLKISEERLKQFPNEKPIKSERVSVKRFDNYVELCKIDMNNYDCLVCDVEGMELHVLKGFGKYLDFINFINVECSREPIYEGQSPAEKVVEFLTAKGFVQQTPIEDHDDIMFIRQPL